MKFRTKKPENFKINKKDDSLGEPKKKEGGKSVKLTNPSKTKKKRERKDKLLSQE